MTHLALDLALGKTGVAWADGSDVYTCPKGLTGGARLNWWLLAIDALLLPHVPVDRLVVEAPILGQTNGAIQLHELHGVARLLAYQRRVGYVTVWPSTLKKTMCGSGRATKEDAILCANALRSYEITDHNEADAVLVWHWGAD